MRGWWSLGAKRTFAAGAKIVVFRAKSSLNEMGERPHFAQTSYQSGFAISALFAGRLVVEDPIACNF